MSTPGPESWDANASAIAQRAAEWLVLRDRGFTPAQREEFELWLQADERHQEAYAELEETWELFTDVPAVKTEADVDRFVLPLLGR